MLEKISAIYFECGIKSVTMDDLARKLGVSKKTLYLHFRDKKDVVEKVLMHQLQNHRCDMAYLEIKNANAIEQILAVSRFLVSFISRIHPSVNFDLEKYYPSIWKKLINYRQEHVFESIRNNMLKGIEEGLYRNDFNVDIIAWLYTNRIQAQIDSEFIQKSGITIEAFFHNLFTYHIRGIASAKGLLLLEKFNDITKTEK